MAIISDIWRAMKNHIASRNNPNVVTRAQLGILSRDEIIGLAGSLVEIPSPEYLALSAWTPDFTKTPVKLINEASGGTTIQVPMGPSWWWGKVWEEGSYRLGTWNSKGIPDGKYPMYIRTMGMNEPTLIYLGSDPREDSVDIMYIGSIVIKSELIISHEFAPVIRFGPYRLSGAPRGSSIPVFNGLPTEPGTSGWW